MKLALTVFVLAFSASLIVAVVIATVVEAKREYRHRHAQPVAPGPILTHGEMTRRQAAKARERAGYIDTPTGKERIGL